MLEFIINIDTILFRFLNGSISNPVFDLFMPFITNEKYWLPVYMIMFLWLFVKGGKKGRMVGIILLINIVISDQLNSSILKDIFNRLRPCHTLEDVHLLVGCGSGKSFPSSHAVNNFAAGFILSFYYKQNKWIFMSIASVVAFSRISVGVHYPFDIIGGAIIGSIIGFIIVFISESFRQKYLKSIKV